MAGSFFPVFGSALAGWLSGIGRPALVTAVTFISLVVNALLAWGLVLGEWGLPRMGIAGAALATVSAQLVAALLYTFLFARSGGFGNPLARALNRAEFRRFLSLAAPMGLRISGELAAWTLFLVVVGRLGTVELAASSIAFRINGIASFLPWDWDRQPVFWWAMPGGQAGMMRYRPLPGNLLQSARSGCC